MNPVARLDAIAGDVLEVLWRSSWQAAVLAAIVLAVQWLTRGRLPARWRYNLWLLVLLRLVIPVTPASPFSLFNLSPRPQPQWSSPMTPTPSSPVPSADVALVVIHATPTMAPAPAPSAAAAAIPWRLILCTAWAAGVMLLAARIAWATLRLSRHVRRMTPVTDATVLEL